MSNMELWFLGAYIAGTVMGYLFARSSASKIAEQTIDVLIEGGFLKSKTNADGEIELIKVNESNE